MLSNCEWAAKSPEFQKQYKELYCQTMPSILVNFLYRDQPWYAKVGHNWNVGMISRMWTDGESTLLGWTVFSILSHGPKSPTNKLKTRFHLIALIPIKNTPRTELMLFGIVQCTDSTSLLMPKCFARVSWSDSGYLPVVCKFQDCIIRIQGWIVRVQA